VLEESGACQDGFFHGLLLRRLFVIEVVAARLLNTTFPVSSGTFGFLAEAGWKPRAIAAASLFYQGWNGLFGDGEGPGRQVCCAGWSDRRPELFGAREAYSDRWVRIKAAARGLHQLPFSTGFFTPVGSSFGMFQPEGINPCRRSAL
jgi:hypothetical protein